MTDELAAPFTTWQAPPVLVDISGAVGRLAECLAHAVAGNKQRMTKSPRIQPPYSVPDEMSACPPVRLPYPTLFRPTKAADFPAVSAKWLSPTAVAPHICRMPEPRRIVVLAVPPIEELDLIGPVQVFSTASRILGRGGAPYEIRVVSTTRDRVIAGESGLSILAGAYYQDLGAGIDSLLVVSGVRERNRLDDELATWLRQTVPHCRRVGAVCISAFLLARAGILTDQRATVHWKYAHELAYRYPGLRVDPNPIWVQAGNIYTSSGFSAGIDLALAWVAEDLGSKVAAEAARELVLFLRRPADQTQLSVTLAAQASEMQPIQELQVWIAENLGRRDLSAAALADRVSMSVRNFGRVFAADVGTTPAKYVLHLRVEAARRLLQTSPGNLGRIARTVGFSSVDGMRRAFVRVLGKSPRELHG
jgi:transcriptional regulator GlxA family with amidase domain